MPRVCVCSRYLMKTRGAKIRLKTAARDDLRNWSLQIVLINKNYRYLQGPIRTISLFVHCFMREKIPTWSWESQVIWDT